MTGLKFGNLTAISRINGTDKIVGKWICKCDCGSVIKVSSSHLTSGKTKSCGCLTSKGELKISNILSGLFIKFDREYIFNDLKSVTSNYLKFDFALFKKNKLICLIEYDGKQHYDKTHYFYSDYLIQNDRTKDKYCKDNNITLYRIRFDQNLEEELDKILIKENLIKNSVKSA